MTKIQKIVETNDIRTDRGFQNAMGAMKSVSDGEIHFMLASNAMTQDLRQQHAIAKAEHDRRSFQEQKKLAKLSGVFGLVVVVVGAVLQALFNWLSITSL